MYKTVKLGDASLQYTIVSQTDDPANSSDESLPEPNKRRSRNRRNNYRNHKRRYRCRGMVVFILIALTLGCGVVIAAVLVPILVASKLTGYLPEAAKFQTFAVAASSVFQNFPSGPRTIVDGRGADEVSTDRRTYVRLLPVKDISFTDRRYRLPDAFNVDGNGVSSADRRKSDKRTSKMFTIDDYKASDIAKSDKRETATTPDDSRNLYSMWRKITELTPSPSGNSGPQDVRDKTPYLNVRQTEKT